MEEEWEEEKMTAEIIKLLKDSSAKQYAEYKVDLANFIEDYAKELS